MLGGAASIGKTLVAGGITIGIITAMTMPGRQSVALVKTGGNVVNGFLGTAIQGHA